MNLTSVVLTLVNLVKVKLERSILLAALACVPLQRLCTKTGPGGTWLLAMSQWASDAFRSAAKAPARCLTGLIWAHFRSRASTLARS